MSTVKQIRDALVVTLAAVPQIGHVYARERYLTDEKKFREIYLYKPGAGEPIANDHLRGWWLRRVETEERQANTARTVNVHTWLVRGFMALKDDVESELVFDDLVEAVRAAVRVGLAPGGSLVSVCQPGPIGGADSETGLQVLNMRPVTFTGVLCHSADLQLTTWTHI